MRFTYYYEFYLLLWGLPTIMRFTYYYEVYLLLWGLPTIMRFTYYYEVYLLLWGLPAIFFISANIPKGCLKSVYHTLFESHLIYGISVWNNTSQANIDKLFRLQKRCIRIIFGDREKFLDKFCTAARTRVFGSQSLGASFYSKEHTKPLFTDNSILTVHNLYTYLSCTEFMKIVKFQTPSSIASKITLSIRNKGILVSLPVKIVTFCTTHR